MRNIKKQIKRASACAAAFLLLAALFSACAKQRENVIFSDVDFENSPYKHITNGGTGDGAMPYNVDVITGATVTVEGPAVEVSIPLSMRELENRDAGLIRGSYTDSAGQYVYEGMDLYYLLHDMIDGDNGIILTGAAYSVEIKDANRTTLAEFALADVTRAHGDGRPILLAYGIGTADEKTAVPFVFNAANVNELPEGYVEELKNDDGCLKLVYDLGVYGANDDYKTFTNAAYVYVKEETEPGFKHTGNANGIYSSGRYTDYIITFRGAAIGREMDFTVRQLEALAEYDSDGNLIPEGIGYSDFYSLANNAYWYVNEYEGLDLYKLLLYLGMEDAETMGLASARTTLVSFVASDGVRSPESFSVDTLSYPDAFGFYNKNALDARNGSYKPTNADLIATGYPVLLAYGVNNYPYTITKGDGGYLSGLSNSGGPFRVVFGKTQYNHANGSNQIQYLKDVIVGGDVLYNTHKYTDDADLKALSERTVSVKVTDESGASLIERDFTVGDIEDIVYAEDAASDVKKAVSVKDFYQVEEDEDYRSDIYEGVSLRHFLMEELGLPGTNGLITFSNGSESVKVNLDRLFRTGYNTELSREGIPSVLAFAKNGSPMVEDEQSAGYTDKIPLNPAGGAEPAFYEVDNDGGPLAVILPGTDPEEPDALSLAGVTSIEIGLIPDAYAHIAAPYNVLADHEVRLYGEGLETETVFGVSDIEGMQTRIKTLDYSMMNGEGEVSEQRYRGMSVWDLFTETGIRNNADKVIVYASDGTESVFDLSRIRRQNYENFLSPEKEPLFAMLAFGKGTVGEDTMTGLPLVRDENGAGYDAAAANGGGPLRLILPQETADSANEALSVKNVTAIEVTVSDIDTWSHSMSGVYEDFLGYEFTLTVRNDENEASRTFTIEQLEAMMDIILRDNYTVLDIGECEGVSVWKFAQKFLAGNEGLDNPVSVTVYAEDGYKNDLLSVFYKDGLEQGVPNGDGERKQLIIAYAVNGYPLVDSESHEGYTGLAGNMGGPLRIVAEGVQGASVKYFNKLVVTLPGDAPLEIKVP